MAKVGRPRKELTDEQIAQVETLAACLTQDQIADYFGISRRTFQDMIQRDDRISAHYKRGKAKAIEDIAGSLLMKARNGDTASAIFFLKTQAKWAEKQEIEHSGDMVFRVNLSAIEPNADNNA
jgi:transposase